MQKAKAVLVTKISVVIWLSNLIFGTAFIYIASWFLGHSSETQRFQIINYFITAMPIMPVFLYIIYLFLKPVFNFSEKKNKKEQISINDIAKAEKSMRRVHIIVILLHTFAYIVGPFIHFLTNPEKPIIDLLQTIAYYIIGGSLIGFFVDIIIDVILINVKKELNLIQSDFRKHNSFVYKYFIMGTLVGLFVIVGFGIFIYKSNTIQYAKMENLCTKIEDAANNNDIYKIRYELNKSKDEIIKNEEVSILFKIIVSGLVFFFFIVVINYFYPLKISRSLKVISSKLVDLCKGGGDLTARVSLTSFDLSTRIRYRFSGSGSSRRIT